MDLSPEQTVMDLDEYIPEHLDNYTGFLPTIQENQGASLD